MLKDATPQGEQHNGTGKLVPPLWHCCQRGRRCEVEKISVEIGGEDVKQRDIFVYCHQCQRGRLLALCEPV